MITSKGVAGVPRASLVILAGTLASYDLPLEGITLILGVDELMDMARTMVNVIGNCLATVVIAKWEGAELTIYGAALPKEIRVGDAVVREWHYDNQNQTVTVTVPDAVRNWTVKLTL